jgi:hypothetical protein
MHACMIWIEVAKGWDKATIKANDEVAAEVDWQCLAGGKRPGSILEALEILVKGRDDELAVGSWSQVADVLDDRMRLVKIARAELTEHGSAYLLEPELENLGVEEVMMLGCVDIGCGEVEVGILECDGALLKAGVDDLGENLGGSHGAEVAWSMIGG